MALRGVCLYRTTILLLKLLVTYVDAQFINNANNITECSGGTASFSWTYATSTPVLFVEWKKDESSIALETGGTFAPEAPYVGRLTKISNAHVSLGSLSVADSGIYKSEVTYTDGNAYASNSVSLVVYDELNSETRIKKTSGTRMVTLSPVFLDLSITYTWKSQDNVTHMTGFSLDVTKIGNYTMCISGGRADCLNPALSPCASIDVTGFDGLITPSSTISSDMSTVSEVPTPPVTTSSAGLSQEIVITIIISCILAAGVLILPVVLVVRQFRQKTRGIPAKNKEHHFANKHNLTKKDDLKSYKPRKSKLLQKRNTKQSTSLDKQKDVQLKNFAPKKRMYQHYPQTTDYLSKCGNQHIFNNSYIEGNMMLYGNRHDMYLQPHPRPINRILNQSHYPPYPGHNEGMFQYYREDNSYRGQQMYQRPYVALYDSHIIDDNQDDNRRSKGRAYEKNWDLLY